MRVWCVSRHGSSQRAWEEKVSFDHDHAWYAACACFAEAGGATNGRTRWSRAIGFLPRREVPRSHRLIGTNLKFAEAPPWSQSHQWNR